jgi:hypothetical protein
VGTIDYVGVLNRCGGRIAVAQLSRTFQPLDLAATGNASFLLILPARFGGLEPLLALPVSTARSIYAYTVSMNSDESACHIPSARGRTS